MELDLHCSLANESLRQTVSYLCSVSYSYLCKSVFGFVLCCKS